MRKHIHWSQNLGFLRNYFIQGFAPADEVLVFRQKDPKPFPPVRGPSGPSATLPNQDGSGTRSAQTALAEKSIRYGDEAAYEGGKPLKKTVFKLRRGGEEIPLKLNTHA